jgi:sigma-B regulation protein RsbU (phosphoserine phosphatase)
VRPDQIRFSVAPLDRRQKERAARSDQLYRGLLATLAQELCSPVWSLAASAGLLLRHAVLPARDRGLVEQVEGRTREIGEVLGDLLDFLLADAGQEIPMEPRRSRIQVICRAALSRAEDRCAVAVEHEHEGGEGTGLWDPERLAQAIGHLLADVASRCPEGAHLRLRSRTSADQVLVRIDQRSSSRRPPAISELDTGAAGEHGRGRLGLGVLLARHIVVQHGGNLARVTAGGGTTYLVALPRERAPVDPDEGGTAA